MNFITNFSTFNQLYETIIGPAGNYGGSVSYHGSQHKEEFEKAWTIILDYLSAHKEEGDSISILEIGAYKGLWALAAACFAPKVSYTTITLMEDNKENQSLHNVYSYYTQQNLAFELISGDSTQSSIVNLVADRKFDFVFIDGNHEYAYVLQDIKNYSPLATHILGFHDIRPKIKTSSVGVYEAIQDSGIKLDHEIVIDGSKMGIGLKWIK